VRRDVLRGLVNRRKLSQVDAVGKFPRPPSVKDGGSGTHQALRDVIPDDELDVGDTEVCARVIQDTVGDIFPLVQEPVGKGVEIVGFCLVPLKFTFGIHVQFQQGWVVACDSTDDAIRVFLTIGCWR